MYLWRGIDLGDGAAAVSGDLVCSVSGAYAGVWMSSGDTGLEEYDLFAGYAMDITDDVSVDVSVWNYNYSGGSDMTAEPKIVTRDDTFGYGSGDFSATFGSHSFDDDSDNMSHLDISYA